MCSCPIWTHTSLHGPILCSAEAVAAHEATYPSRRDDYGPWFRGWLDKGAKVTGAEYAKANNLRAACTGHLRRVFEGIDVLVCPSTSAPPHPVTPEELYGPIARKPRTEIPTIHRAVRFQRGTNTVRAMWIQQRRAPSKHSVGGQASIRTAVVSGWSRLRRGNRMAQSASGGLKISF